MPGHVSIVICLNVGEALTIAMPQRLTPMIFGTGTNAKRAPYYGYHLQGQLPKRSPYVWMWIVFSPVASGSNYTY